MVKALGVSTIYQPNVTCPQQTSPNSKFQSSKIKIAQSVLKINTLPSKLKTQSCKIKKLPRWFFPPLDILETAPPPPPPDK